MKLRLHFVWVGIVVMIASGCTSLPTGRFDSFATSTHAILQSSTDTYTRIDKLESTYMVFNPAPGRLTSDTFAPIILGEDGTKQDFDFAPRLQFRESALNVLAKYADTLQAFAKKDYQGDLDKASQELNSSISGLASQVATPADAKMAGGVLATAVNALGRAIIETKRREALKQAMDKAQGGVETLTRLIAGDNTEIASAVSLMRGGILRVANNVRPPEKSLARLRFDARIALLISETADILGSLKSLNIAVTAIAAAHAEVRQALDRPETELSRLQDLITEAQRLNTFYRTLK